MANSDGVGQALAALDTARANMKAAEERLADVQAGPPASRHHGGRGCCGELPGLRFTLQTIGRISQQTTTTITKLATTGVTSADRLSGAPMLRTRTTRRPSRSWSC